MDTISEFYSPLAESYDQMLSFDHRLDSARRFVAALRERIGGFSTAADFACGTGVYAMALAEQAERVFGSDLSSAMIEQARTNGAQRGLEIEWLVKPMQEPLAEEPLDLALCMGNSLPHLLETDDLKQALQNFFATLKSGGSLVLHLLNYCRILQRRERIIG